MLYLRAQNSFGVPRTVVASERHVMAQPVGRMTDRIRLLIVAADHMSGELLKNAFASRRNGFSVATLTGSSHKVIDGLGTLTPHIALVSEELEDGPRAGFEVLKRLRQFHQQTAAIMLLRYSRPECVINAFRTGARGVFHRNHSFEALPKCILAVHQGQIWAGNEDLEHLLTALSRSKTFEFNNAEGLPLLTRREEDVVRLVADGLKNREIGQKLGISEHSVRNYLYRIFDKLGVSTRFELILHVFSNHPGN